MKSNAQVTTRFVTRSRRALPSTTALARIPFTPTSATLEAAIAAIGSDGSGSANDAATRRTAFSRYGDLPVPSGHPGRTWRYDYTKLTFDDLVWSTGRASVPTMPLSAAPASEPDLDRPALATDNVGGLVHLGSILLEAPGRTALDERIVVTSLADAQIAHAELLAAVQHQIVKPERDAFTALATAFQNCGAFIYVPAGVQLDAPIQLLFASSDSVPAAVFPHVVIVLGEGARATVIERHSGSGATFVCGIVEAHVGAKAQLDLVTVQQADEEARLFMTRAARIENHGTMRTHLAELGGAIARSVLDADLSASGATGEISALFFTGGMQHVDLTTESLHAVGQTTSNVVVRSAATDRGQGRFFGNIRILPHSHGSEASLRDDVLLMSKHSHIDSIPALEIAANDVRAFHGATVGSLDEDQLFYALSRGISRPDALRMIALGFFEPVISRFPGEALRDEIRTALDRKIDEATEIDL